MITKGMILSYHQQIQQWHKQGSVHELFEKSKINEFYKEFGIRIETIQSDLKAMEEKYFVKNEKGIIKTEGEKGKEIPVYKEGFNQEMFNAEYIEYMQSELGVALKATVNG